MLKAMRLRASIPVQFTIHKVRLMIQRASILAGWLKPLRREGAQAAFEFMLVIPVFIPFILITVDFGTMMYEYVSISNAVREGARYASVNCETGACTVALVQQRTVDRSGGIMSDTSEVTVGWRDVNGNSADGSTGKGDSVVVKVSHPYHFLFFPNTVNVTSCADYRLEQQDTGVSLPTGTAC